MNRRGKKTILNNFHKKGSSFEEEKLFKCRALYSSSFSFVEMQRNRSNKGKLIKKVSIRVSGR